VITPQSDDPVDLDDLLRYMKQNLPPYAVPVFVRIKSEIEVTGTFKYKKADLKKEGFDPLAGNDPLHVLLPGEPRYVPLTAEIHANVSQGAYRF